MMTCPSEMILGKGGENMSSVYLQGNPMDDDDMADEDGSIEENPMDIDASEDGDAIGSEDEFYKEVKKRRAEKLKAKAELYSRYASILENLKLYGSSLFCCMVSCVMKAVLMSYCIICHTTPAIPLSVEPEADGKWQITYQMEKNRGLTRPRKKLTKIPRKKYKIKHQKAVIRRKGQVRDIRKPAGPYGGESTGINTSVSRSVRFKS